MRPLVLTCLSLLLYAWCSAQQMKVVATDEPPLRQWDRLFIERNAIALISGSVSLKKEGMPIINKKKKYLFKFDDTGKLTYQNTTFGLTNTAGDTASVFYEYDKQGQCSRSIRKELGGYFEQTYAFDATGRVSHTTYSKVIGPTVPQQDSIPGRRIEISDETYRYISNGNATVRTYINDVGLPYRERTYTYNQLGYLISIEDLLLITREKSIEQFTYDEKGRLRMHLAEGKNGKPPITTTYVYDKVNNLVSREIRDGAVHRIREEYLYSKENGLMSAMLVKDMHTNIITIIKYDYRFR